MLCQLSYAPSAATAGRHAGAATPKPWLGAESNRRHPRFQRGALPTELPSLNHAPRPIAAASSGGGIRTHDLVVNSHPLWPLSYPGTPGTSPCKRGTTPLSKKRPARQRGAAGHDSGGGIRTRDLRVMSPTSYQTAPPRNECPIVSATPDRVNRQPARKRRLAAPQAKIRRLPAPGAASTLAA